MLYIRPTSRTCAPSWLGVPQPHRGGLSTRSVFRFSAVQSHCFRHYFWISHRPPECASTINCLLPAGSPNIALYPVSNGCQCSRVGRGSEAGGCITLISLHDFMLIIPCLVKSSPLSMSNGCFLSIFLLATVPFSTMSTYFYDLSLPYRWSNYGSALRLLRPRTSSWKKCSSVKKGGRSGRGRWRGVWQQSSRSFRCGCFLVILLKLRFANQLNILSSPTPIH